MHTIDIIKGHYNRIIMSIMNANIVSTTIVVYYNSILLQLLLPVLLLLLLRQARLPLIIVVILSHSYRTRCSGHLLSARPHRSTGVNDRQTEGDYTS